MCRPASQHHPPRRAAPMPWTRQPAAPPMRGTSKQALSTRQRLVLLLPAASTPAPPVTRAAASVRTLQRREAARVPPAQQGRATGKSRRPGPAKPTLDDAPERHTALQRGTRARISTAMQRRERAACLSTRTQFRVHSSLACENVKRCSEQPRSTRHTYTLSSPDARSNRARVPQKEQRTAPGTAARHSSTLAGCVRLRQAAQQRSRERVGDHEGQHLHDRVSAHHGAWCSTASRAKTPQQPHATHPAARTEAAARAGSCRHTARGPALAEQRPPARTLHLRAARTQLARQGRTATASSVFNGVATSVRPGSGVASAGNAKRPAQARTV